MVIRLTIAIMAVLASQTTFCQGVSTEEADSLLRSLSERKTDVEQMDIFLKVAEFYIFKPGEDKVDFDEARKYMRKAALLNVKLKSQDADAFQLLLESRIDRESQHVVAGKEITETAVSRLSKGKNKFYLGTAYFCLSEYYSWANAHESGDKRRLMELAVQAFEQTQNVEQLAYCLKHRADLYALNDEREKAIKDLDRSLRLYESINYGGLHIVYVLYSHVYYTDGNYKLALKYGLMALEKAKAVGDSSMSLCQINNYVGNTLVRLKENEKAIAYYQDALKVAQQYNDNNSVLQVMANIVQNYIELKKLDEALAFMDALPRKNMQPKLDESYIFAPLAYLNIYYALEDYPAAQSYSNQILKLIKIHRPSDQLLHNFYHSLVRFYLQSGQYASANMRIGTIDSLSKKIGDPHRIKEDYYLKFRLDSAEGHWNSAMGNLLKYQTLNDSLFNETTSRQIRHLEVEYETEKHKNEITVLNQKNQLQQSHLDRAQLVKNFTIGGIALLFVIIGLLFWQYRNKQKSNEVILQKNEQLQHFLTEKEWLAKEIHHRVKNNFHIVASLLEIQSSYLKNKEALSAIKESQNRIHSMSIIHQKLYQSETLSTIHMPDYIYELVEYLRDSYGIREKIGFSLEIENIELDHRSAITLGLILNEVITNAIKYAFAKTDNGRILISLSHISDEKILLTIQDNGPGLPKDFKNGIRSAMGMELLRGLTDDIGGTLSIENDNGACIKISFKQKEKARPEIPVS